MLTIELVPKTCWFSNVRSHVTRSEWDIIRKQVYYKAKYHCEICGDVGTNQGRKHPVECHEIWEYDDVNLVQKLIGMIALCPNCHTTKHPGLAGIRGRTEIVTRQLMKVNNWTRQKALLYTDKCFRQWAERSRHQWELNLEHLKDYDIGITRISCKINKINDR